MPKHGNSAAYLAARIKRDHPVIADVPKLAKHGTNQHNGGGTAGTSSRGANPAYLAARIKRDHPVIAARIDEFPSIRAAARAAGIIKDQDDTKILERMWKRSDAATWCAIVEWVHTGRGGGGEGCRISEAFRFAAPP